MRMDARLKFARARGHICRRSRALIARFSAGAEPTPNLPATSGHSFNNEQVSARWTICHMRGRRSAGGAALGAVSGCRFAAATAQAQSARPCQPARTPRKRTGSPPAAAAPPNKLPPRIPFTAADEAAAAIPGMPDARFWADSAADFDNALPPQPGPWLILSTGGADGAFGAGLLNGLSAGRKPAGLCGRHRREHRRADGALCVCRPALRRRPAAPPIRKSRPRTFSKSAAPARALSIRGRSRT